MRIKKLAAACLAGALMISAFTGCAMDKNETVATLGEQEISLGLANFMCRYQQAGVDTLYRSYFGEDVWSQDLMGDGTTAAESIKMQVMDALHEMYTLKNNMEEYDVEITEADKTAITKAATEFMEANSKEALEEMGATQEIVEEMLTLYTIQSKMMNAIKAEADTEVTDEEANMRAYSMIYFSTAGYYDETLQGQVTYSEEQIERVEKSAKDAWEDLQEETDMKAVAESYGYSATTGTYDADDETLEADVKKALDALGEGEMSEVITTDNGFYIVRLDSETDVEATEKNKEKIVEERKTDLYNEVLSGWQEDDGWEIKESVLKKIKIKNYLTSETESTEEDTQSTEDTEITEATETTESTEDAE